MRGWAGVFPPIIERGLAYRYIGDSGLRRRGLLRGRRPNHASLLRSSDSRSCRVGTAVDVWGTVELSCTAATTWCECAGQQCDRPSVIDLEFRWLFDGL